MYKPIIQDIKPFNAKEGYYIKFKPMGNAQIVGHTVKIMNADTGNVEYLETIDSLRYEHYLSPFTLTNGKRYTVEVSVKDVSGKTSPYSNPVMFWCFTPPTITIDNIDEKGRVYNQTVTFKATYNQAEGEGVESYRFNLYSSNRGLLKTYDEQFAKGSKKLEQEVAGLENGKNYYIEVKTLTPNGLHGTSGLVPFKPLYIAPKVSVTLEPVNDFHEGAIKLKTHIVQLFMTLYDNKGNKISPEKVTYVDDSKINLNRYDYSKLEISEGINVYDGNFTLQIWAKNIRVGLFSEILFHDGRVAIERINNRLLGTVYLRGHKHHYRYISNEFNANIDNCITIHYGDGMLDIDIKPSGGDT